MNNPTFFIFDVESIGLHGEGYAVAGGVYGPNGKLLGEEFCYSCPPEVALGSAEDRKWVSENIVDLEITHESPLGVRAAFWNEWLEAKKEYPGIFATVECGWPVEARFLNACVRDDFKQRKEQAPYPLQECASLMLCAGLDSLASYERLPDELPKHHPMADARHTARLMSMALAKCPRFWI